MAQSNSNAVGVDSTFRSKLNREEYSERARERVDQTSAIEIRRSKVGNPEQKEEGDWLLISRRATQIGPGYAEILEASLFGNREVELRSFSPQSLEQETEDNRQRGGLVFGDHNCRGRPSKSRPSKDLQRRQVAERDRMIIQS
ncbi:hypothetical protein AAC387_Pa08g0912 [Persea americana]